MTFAEIIHTAGSEAQPHPGLPLLIRLSCRLLRWLPWAPWARIGDVAVPRRLPPVSSTSSRTCHRSGHPNRLKPTTVLPFSADPHLLRDDRREDPAGLCTAHLLRLQPQLPRVVGNPSGDQSLPFRDSHAAQKCWPGQSTLPCSVELPSLLAH